MEVGEKIIFNRNCENKKLAYTICKISLMFTMQMFKNIMDHIFIYNLNIITQTVD